jgi:hypothetical protein
MTKTLSSSMSSLEPPLIVTPTLEASATETEAVVAPLPTETPSEPQGLAIVLTSTSQLADLVIETTKQTQTTSPRLLVTQGPLEFTPEGSTA